MVRLPALAGRRDAGVIASAGPVARRLRVTGVVQGVGFRPFVHRLALRLGLAGAVRNVGGDVEIDAEGPAEALDAFARALRAEAPPLARISAVEVAPLAPAGREGFAIAESDTAEPRRPAVPADVALCAACARELADPADRRYRHPFITCTDCGPRYSVIEALPYDRARTAMRAFPPCPACAAEYAAPGDRRHHAETNCCPACGPRLWFEPGQAGATAVPGTEPALAAAAALLRAGGIVAVRGMGGFHLAVDATDEAAVTRLRERKHRDAKPFAVLVRTLAEARALALVDDAAAALLVSAERPIVLLPARAGSGLARAVAPGLGTVGLMLPSTPLHELLAAAVGRPLVMTSGNRSEEPIAAGLDEGRERLGAIADGFLLHDREIVARVDDSVVRPTPAGPVLVRRARGHAPLPVPLPVASPRPLVAVGAELKHTFALADGALCWPGPHGGDLQQLETLEHVRRTLARYRALFRVEPEVAVRDLHPGYLSTRLAAELGCARTIAVQHHHAHVAAVLAEHGETGPAVGLAWDGTGFGDDGHSWGAETLVADLAGYRRVARLRYLPLPGGDLAAREGWRVVAGALALEPGAEAALTVAFAGLPDGDVALVRRQAARGLNAPLASSMGRLFDAAAAVLGVRAASRYEGQAAMALEALAGERPAEPLPFPAQVEDGVLVLDPVPLLVALGERRAAGCDPAGLAASFHEAVARAALACARHARALGGPAVAALGGGTFQNARLLARVAALLERDGVRVLLARRLGPNDGAISYGQAAVAAATLAREGAA